MQEPSHLSRIRSELEAFDPSLDIRLNLERNLWEIRVRGRRTGTWHHVFFWGNGALGQQTYRDLPTSAKPLLERLYEIDTMRYGDKVPITRLLEQGFSENRARLLVKRNQDWRERLGEYARYLTPSKLVELNRKVRLGGAAGKQAEEDRRKAIMEILVPQEHERIIVPHG